MSNKDKLAALINTSGAHYNTYFNDFYTLKTEKIESILNSGDKELLGEASYFSNVEKITLTLADRVRVEKIQKNNKIFTTLHTSSEYYKLMNFVREHSIPEEHYKLEDRFGSKIGMFYKHRFALQINKDYLFRRFNTTNIAKRTKYDLPRQIIKVKHLVDGKLKTTSSDKQLIFVDMEKVVIHPAKSRKANRKERDDIQFFFRDGGQETMLIVNKQNDKR